jgi:hypothetical protein
MLPSKSREISNYLLTVLLLLGALGLLAGLYAGFNRLGLWAGSSRMISPLMHGPLMVDGFLGTLIGLERAAALQTKWAYGAPFFFAVGTVLLIFAHGAGTLYLYIVASIFFLAIMFVLYRMQPMIYHIIMILGGACLLVGNVLLFMNIPIFNMVAWWFGFLLLTIFAERLELNRILRPPEWAQQIFLALTVLWIAGVIITYFHRYIGWAIACIMLIIQALWLFKCDVARRTIKADGWTRYSAICLLTGYGWLILAGLFGLGYGFPRAGFLYDAQLHMIFLGFVFSMIFAHLSVIIPSLSGKMIPYRPIFYIPLIFLHGFLLVRVIGDIAGFPFVRLIGGYGNIAAILLFLGSVLFQLIRETRRRKTQIFETKNRTKTADYHE